MRRGFEREQERLTEKLGQMSEYLLLMDAMDELIAENRKLQEEIASVQQQLADAKRQQAELEMQLTETRKLSEGVVKKSSEEGVVKAISTYVNRSKRKTPDKRAYIKNMILDFANVNGLSLPDELSATIDCLDDEQIQNVEVGGTGVIKQYHE